MVMSTKTGSVGWSSTGEEGAVVEGGSSDPIARAGSFMVSASRDSPLKSIKSLAANEEIFGEVACADSALRSFEKLKQMTARHRKIHVFLPSIVFQSFALPRRPPKP
jgi:hypothetical protein